MAKKKVKTDYIEENMLFTDKKIFGDNEEHEFDVFCYDGRAIAIPAICELLDNVGNEKYPRLLEVLYPKKEELTDEQKIECLHYRGIYDQPASMCHAGDICMSLGKLHVIA